MSRFSTRDDAGDRLQHPTTDAYWWLLIGGLYGGSHAFSNDMALYLASALGGLLILRSPRRGFVLLVFLVPWAPVMRFNEAQPSLLTILTVVTFTWAALHPNRTERVSAPPRWAVAAVVLLVVLTASVKLIAATGMTSGYLSVMLLLLLIPGFLISGDLPRLGVASAKALGLGSASAALVALLLGDQGRLPGFITVFMNPITGLTRSSGFYPDPNYYSAQLLFAASGLLALGLSRTRLVGGLWVLLGLALAFLGAMAVSKSFLILATIVAVLLFFSTVVAGWKGLASLTLLVGGLYIVRVLFTDTLDGIIAMYEGRLSTVSDLESLTTTRSTIADRYLDLLFQDSSILLFGQGFSEYTPFGRAAHNSLIQAIWLLGIVGTIVLAWWAYYSLTKGAGVGIVKVLKSREALAVSVAFFGPAFSLDLLLFESSYLLFVHWVALVGVLLHGSSPERLGASGATLDPPQGPSDGLVRADGH